MIAQTNLQLDRQLEGLNWPEPDRGAIADAYRLAVELFGGAIRSSGKPFLCHLVGTASVVAASGGSADLVAAGLLHAAYDVGHFGDGTGRSPGHVRTVRASVGDRVEAFVAAYHRLEVSHEVVASLEARADRLSPHERRMLLLVLANEVDDHLDGGVAVVAADLPWRNQPETVARLVELARRAGFSAIGDELDSQSATRLEVIPEGVRQNRAKRFYWAPVRFEGVRDVPWTRILRTSVASGCRRSRRLWRPGPEGS